MTESYVQMKLPEAATSVSVLFLRIVCKVWRKNKNIL